jgi:chromosome partitioning protein
MEEGDESILKELLEGIRHDFDYLILDSPPGKAMLAINALTAADEVIIPLQAERPALDGVQDILRFIQEIIWEKHNPSLKLRGILPTMYKRTTAHAEGVVKKAREIWGDKVFQIEVPETIVFPRAFSHGAPITHYAPDHDRAKAYMALARLLHEGS